MSLPTIQLAKTTASIPGLGDVPLREMNGTQRDRYDSLAYKASQTGDFSGVRTALIRACLDIDEDAEPWLADLPGRFIDPLHEACLTLNGIGNDAGNSQADPSGGSGSS
jgi:hypothetical protein